MGSLTGKTAVVTGSTSGIGLAIARAFAGAGANIVINGFGAPADIEREALRLAAGVADLLGHVGGGLRVDICHDDPCALAGIAVCDGASDAGAGAGDDSDVVGEKGHGAFPLFCDFDRG